MLPSTYVRYILNERPKAAINETTLRKVVDPLDLQPGPQQVLVRTVWISLDPAIREWMNDRISFLPPSKLGETMRAFGIGSVIKAGSEATIGVGTLVTGFVGFSEYALLDLATSEPIQPEMLPDGVVPEDYLGALGVPGMAAYFGLKNFSRMKPGCTLVVTAAAGATGSMACQLGKRWGAKVVAITGNAEKCDWLRELGCDVVLCYRSPTFTVDFERDVDRFDVHFDNVGGELANYLMGRVNRGATIVLSGGISHYNSVGPLMNTQSNTFLHTVMRVRSEGFVATDFIGEWGPARQLIRDGLIDGTLKRKFHVVSGLENVVEALQCLFTGGNMGKLLIRIAPLKE